MAFSRNIVVAILIQGLFGAGLVLQTEDSARNIMLSSDGRTQPVEIRHDLTGITLNISLVDNGQEKYDTNVHVDSHGKLTLLPCMVSQLLTTLQLTLNFTFNLKLANHWGKLDRKTLQWKGMVRQLVDKEVDIGLSSTFDIATRRDAVDFTIPLYSLHFIAVYRPKTFKQGHGGYFSPFRWDLWVAILFWLILLAIFLAMLHFSSKKISNLSHAFQRSLYPNRTSEPSDIFVLISSVLCGKTIPLTSIAHGRALTVSASLVVMVLGCAFSGTLISFLSVKKMPFRSITQLLASDHAFDLLPLDKYKSIENNFSIKELESLTRAKHVRLHKVFVSAKPSLMKGSYVFISDDLHIYEGLYENFTEQERCTIGKVSLNAKRIRDGPVIQKNSPYKRAIDFQLLRIKQFGLAHAWFQRHAPTSPKCMNGSVTMLQGIPAGSILSALYLLAGGMATSIVCLVIERFLPRSRIIKPLA